MPTINQKFMKQEVAYDGTEAIGTIIVDTENHFLYLVTAKGQALRYGIGVGRAGFEWKGTEKISRKAEWPDWFPPEDMLKRAPICPCIWQVV
jgi:lipoprotein-anchoring transpeptidase ErfK/SrfK